MYLGKEKDGRYVNLESNSFTVPCDLDLDVQITEDGTRHLMDREKHVHSPVQACHFEWPVLESEVPA